MLRSRELEFRSLPSTTREGDLADRGEGREGRQQRRGHAVIRISITPAAFEAITSTLPLGSVGFEPAPDAKGERLVG
jgi:hypothetical protein